MRNRRSTRHYPPLVAARRCAPVAGVVFALAVLLLAGCRVVDDRPLYRCLDALDRWFLSLPELPDQAHGARFGSSVTETREVFEIEQDADVELPDPAAYVATLCRHLQARVAERCTVTETLVAPDHCSFEVTAPDDATTGPDGVHHHRRMRGRVQLIAQPADDGRTRLHLTAVEWPG